MIEMKKKQLEKHFQGKRPLGVSSVSAFAGFAIYGIVYGIEDFLIVAYETENTKSFHKCQIHHDFAGRAFFYLFKMKHYVEDFVRV